MKIKSKVGRKPKDGIRAMTKAERQKKYRLRKNQDLLDAANNFNDAKTDALLKLILIEFNKIDDQDAGNLSVVRKVIVELCNRYSIPIEQVEYDTNGLIDIDDDAVQEIAELRDDTKRLERLRRLIDIHESELNAINENIEFSEKDEINEDAPEDRACEEILLELLYNEVKLIS